MNRSSLVAEEASIVVVDVNEYWVSDWALDCSVKFVVSVITASVVGSSPGCKKDGYI